MHKTSVQVQFEAREERIIEKEKESSNENKMDEKQFSVNLRPCGRLLQAGCIY